MKLALAVGLRYIGSAHELPGSSQTASDWAKLLRLKGFTTTLLLEAKAHRKAIAAAIRAMYAKCKGPDDQIAIVWSGHGLRLTFTTGETINALVPYDAVLPTSNWNLCIPDYQFKAILAERPPRCRLFTCIDVCFSGSFRDAAAVGAVPQYIPPQNATKIQTFGWDDRIHKYADSSARFIAERLEAMAPLPNTVSFHPSGAGQVSVQMPGRGGLWKSMFSGCLHELMLMKTTASWSYSRMFAEAKLRAMRRYPLAQPEVHGDGVMLKKGFLK
jgi:hypothetical protein